MKVTGIWTTLSANWVKLCHDSLTYSMRRNCYAQDTSPGKALFSTLGIVALFNHANTHGRKCVMTHSLFSLSLLQTYLLNFITLCQSVTFYPNYKLICILQHMLQCHFSRLCLHLLRQELHRFRYFVPRVGDRVWLWGAGECRKMCGEDKKLWSGWKLSGFQVWLYVTRRGLQHHSPHSFCRACIWLLLCQVTQKALTTPSLTQAALREGTSLCPEADGLLGCQASGDVGTEETFVSLKPTAVGTEHNMILWAMGSPLRPLLLLNPHSQKQATWSKHLPLCFSRLVNAPFEYISLQTDWGALDYS